MRRASTFLILVLLLTITVAACKGKAKPPVARPQPPVAGGVTDTAPPPPAEPPQPVMEQPVSVPTLPPDDLLAKGIDDLNRDSPLKPLFFELDSNEVSPSGQQVLQENAAVLKKYPSMQVTIEGHCDERGTAEYNLALGERRALAARNYLVSLGIPADRIKTVSYGKEFPFDAGHDEGAWRNNRRAHFVITAK
ncbi:MAG TPA: peptidoglycan-associated lipoprotein Pal [Vicinamibacterales bacterium]|nr:peptidoglycan-associated lipoprotein Pal [Vicinamibacterales bacterium]